MKLCRTCKSERLYVFLELGDHPLANGFLRADQLDEPELRFPLDVHACLDCGLIQVADHVPAGYFRHYVYVPSASEVMHDHFRGLADRLAPLALASPDALTIDIGCNDGLFLGALQERGGRTLGIDPATNIVELARARGVEVVNEYLTPELGASIRDTHGPASVVVTTNTFHHVDDLDAFMEAVGALLADDGVFVVEVPHALEIVEQNEFDGVYHEHVSQLTVKSFVDLFRRFGMAVTAIERLDVHGGSLRVFAQGEDQARPPGDVEAWVEEERRRGLFEAATYDAFRERVGRLREELVSLLGDLRASGARLAGYGASARGNTLLNYYGIGPDLLDFVADRNELKQGLYTPGTHLPVVAPERILEERPDHLLVIAWNFADEIIRQQHAYRAAGGSFILPLPEVRVANPEGT